MRNLIRIVEGIDAPLPEVLYHGTNAEFDTFDRAFARTANHIYTSPDIETAAYYGKIVYECRVFGPQADITHEGDSALLGRLATEFADRFTDHVGEDEDLHALAEQIVAENSHDEDFCAWDAEDDPRYIALLNQKASEYALNFFTDGKIYDFDHKGAFQDEVLDTVMEWGYRSLRFTDHSPVGESLSVVARENTDIVMIRRVQ